METNTCDFSYQSNLCFTGLNHIS